MNRDFHAKFHKLIKWVFLFLYHHKPTYLTDKSKLLQGMRNWKIFKCLKSNFMGNFRNILTWTLHQNVLLFSQDSKYLLQRQDRIESIIHLTQCRNISALDPFVYSNEILVGFPSLCFHIFAIYSNYQKPIAYILIKNKMLMVCKIQTITPKLRKRIKIWKIFLVCHNCFLEVQRNNRQLSHWNTNNSRILNMKDIR